MHKWYRAACDKHKETINLYVDNPSRTAIYLSDQDGDIQAWLDLHYACEIRLVWRGDQEDVIWNAGYWDPIKKLPPSADPAKRIS